eukprot:1761783-Rhodomonas_salina.1
MVNSRAELGMRICCWDKAMLEASADDTLSPVMYRIQLANTCSAFHQPTIFDMPALPPRMANKGVRPQKWDSYQP